MKVPSNYDEEMKAMVVSACTFERSKMILINKIFCTRLILL
jgi:hypothetical protein